MESQQRCAATTFREHILPPFVASFDPIHDTELKLSLQQSYGFCIDQKLGESILALDHTENSFLELFCRIGRNSV